MSRADRRQREPDRHADHPPRRHGGDYRPHGRDGGLFLREGARISGTLSLNGANLGAILDDPACWPAKGDLRLNRCLYGALLGGAIEARTRLDWLARQTPERWGEDFWPQPYEQLATVLGQMGHDEDKRRVLVRKEKLARRARRRRARNPLTRFRLTLIDGLMGANVVYGNKPLLAMFWILRSGLRGRSSTRTSMTLGRRVRMCPWSFGRLNGCCAPNRPGRAQASSRWGRIGTGLPAPTRCTLPASAASPRPQPSRN